jgi:hypothetical protein
VTNPGGRSAMGTNLRITTGRFRTQDRTIRPGSGLPSTWVPSKKAGKKLATKKKSKRSTKA